MQIPSKREIARQWVKNQYEQTGDFPAATAVSEFAKIDLRSAFRVLAEIKPKIKMTAEEAPAPDETIQKIIEADKLSLIVNSLTINTIEQALAVADVDMSEWRVKSSRVNSWQVHMKVKEPGGLERIEKRTNYQVRVDLVPRLQTVVDCGMKLLIDRLINGYKPEKPRLLAKPSGEYMLEIALFDAHFGKLAWDKETRQGDYDIQIAEETYTKACNDLIQHASSHRIEKILFPFGNDFFHVNNPEGTTPVGKHQLDMDTRLPKIWVAGKMALIKAIDMCLQVAPVELVWVPGNHDPDTSWFLTEVVREMHRGNKFLTVDNTPAWRKARLYGKFLVAFAHAATEKVQKLPNIMMVDFRDLMAKAKYCEWHIGHLHKKDEFKFQPTVTEAGIIVRRIPALSRIDAWHYKYGFVDAVRAGEAFLIHKERGVVNHITCNM